jgi:hypothetical protein
MRNQPDYEGSQLRDPREWKSVQKGVSPAEGDLTDVSKAPSDVA